MDKEHRIFGVCIGVRRFMENTISMCHGLSSVNPLPLIPPSQIFPLQYSIPQWEYLIVGECAFSKLGVGKYEDQPYPACTP